MQFSTVITPPEGAQGKVSVDWQVSSSAEFRAEHLIDSGITSTSAEQSWVVIAETKDQDLYSKLHYRFLIGNSEVGYGQTQTIEWEDQWRELDLVLGLSTSVSGMTSTVDPTKYNVSPRDNIQLPGVLLKGSINTDLIHIGTDSEADTGPGNDILLSIDSKGGNTLVGGMGADEFLLQVQDDDVVGGSYISDPSSENSNRRRLALSDEQTDTYLIDTSDRGSDGTLQIHDFEVGTDRLLIDGIEASGMWPIIKKDLSSFGLDVNGAPQADTNSLSFTLIPGVETFIDLSSYISDPDGELLRLVKLAGPTWMEAAGTRLKANTPANITQSDINGSTLELAITDSIAITKIKAPSLSLLSNTFVNGVASGDPLKDSVILWTRVNPKTLDGTATKVTWELSTSEVFAESSIVNRGSFVTDASRDWTVKVEAAGLTPGTSYYYRFSKDGVISPIGQTRTLAINSYNARIALFSCANFTAEPEFAVYGKAAEINGKRPYDAWVHVGDYIYEYGKGGYSSAEGSVELRGFKPDKEIVSLDDYRQRYAQYHTDANLQTLRQSAPLIAIWDDHETANKSYKDGAQNHQPATEGDWSTRVANAMQAYYEWMPIREPQLRDGTDQGTSSTPLTKANRSFDFGDVLSLHMLETRLTARDPQLSYPSSDVESALNVAEEAYSGERSMIGSEQLNWLQNELATSKAAWQALGSGTLFANMAIPAELLLNQSEAVMTKYATPLQKLANGLALSPEEQALFNEAGKIPYNLDAWDGYGAEREQIIDAALKLDKRLVSLAGDTHNAWSSVIDSNTGEIAGVEFAGPGVSSPGLESQFSDPYLIRQLFLGYVTDLRYAELEHRGFVDLTFTADSVFADYNYITGADPSSQQSIWSTDTLYTDASLAIAELKKQSGTIDFSVTTDRTRPVILDVLSTQRAGRLYDETLLPRAGDFRLRLDQGGFSADFPDYSNSRDVIQLEYKPSGILQEVSIDEKVRDESGVFESIANAARGLISGIINNYIHTRIGDDEIIGSPGSDFIRAGEGNDFVDAGLGNDLVRSGSGNDRVILGSGADQLLITRDQLEGTDTLGDFSELDRLVLADGISVIGGIGSQLLSVGYPGGNQQQLLLTDTSVAFWSLDQISSL
jgi:phosphodiesterase/alkaline phosphatase D-like protein